MTRRDLIYALQVAQLEHDEKYHKDVVIMPLAERVKHMALHNAKYVGYLVDALENGDDIRVEQVLTDAFIITLATANTLNQDLGIELIEQEGANGLAGLGADLAITQARPDSDQFWLVKEFARHTSAMAKACESWDHMESVPFRDLMRDSNFGLFKLLLAEAAMRQIDLEERYRSRSRQVETRSIFDRAYHER